MSSPLNWAIDLQTELPAWQERLAGEIDQNLQPILGALRDMRATVLDHLDNLLQKVQPNRPAAPPTAVSVVRLPPKQFPSGVDRWFNIYDNRDPVACEGGLGGRTLALGETFLSQKGYQRAFDVTIRNDACPAEVLHVNMRAHMDYHDGYGQCAELAQVTADFWERFGGQWAPQNS
jgi:hypothetical protein